MQSSGERARLEREGDVLARFVAGCPLSARGRERYVAAHARGELRPPRGVGGFDRVLVGLARTGTLGARIADAHASLLDRGGLLRHKLVLVLALLESSSPGEERVDRPSVSSHAAFLFGAALRAGLSLVLLALFLVPLLLLRALCALALPRRAHAESGA